MKDKSKRIAYIVSHGFAARMILQTDLLAKLSTAGHQLILICPDPDDPVLRAYCQVNNIQLVKFKTTKWVWRSNYTLYRSYFLEDIKANPALYEKHYYEIHHSKQRFKILKFIPHLLILFYHLIKVFPVLRKFYKKKEEFLLNDRKAKFLLHDLAIDLLVSTYPANANEGILLHNARQLNMRTVIHLLSWDNISCKGHFLSLADKYISWGPVMTAELKQYYKIEDRNIFECGVPHFDLHLNSMGTEDSKNNLKILNIHPDQPYLLFGMSAPRFVPYEIDIVEYLAKKIEQNVFGKNTCLIIRPHPQNLSGGMADPQWIERLYKIQSDRVKLFLPLLVQSNLPWSMELEDMKNLSAVLRHCAVCINSCSTLSIDSLMAGRGNIAPMFDADKILDYWHSAARLTDYNHIKKFIALGGTVLVRNYQELDAEILQFLANSNYQLEAREHTAKMECGESPGDATNKVIYCLKAIASSPD